MIFVDRKRGGRSRLIGSSESASPGNSTHEPIRSRAYDVYVYALGMQEIYTRVYTCASRDISGEIYLGKVCVLNYTYSAGSNAASESGE